MSQTKKEDKQETSQRVDTLEPLEIEAQDDQKPTCETEGGDEIKLNKKEIKVGAVFANIVVIAIGFLQYGKA